MPAWGQCSQVPLGYVSEAFSSLTYATLTALTYSSFPLSSICAFTCVTSVWDPFSLLGLEGYMGFH